MVDKDFFLITTNTLLLAAITSVITLLLALIMIYGKRISQSFLSEIVLRIVSIGYVLPGTVIAIGILIPFAWLDNHLNQVMANSFGSNVGLLFSGSIFILIFSYCTRFLAVSIHTIDASIEKISMNIDDIDKQTFSFFRKEIMNEENNLNFDDLRDSCLEGDARKLGAN